MNHHIEEMITGRIEMKQAILDTIKNLQQRTVIGVDDGRRLRGNRCLQENLFEIEITDVRILTDKDNIIMNKRVRQSLAVS